MSCLSPTKPAMLRSRALWLHYMLAELSDDEHFDMQTFVQRRRSSLAVESYASYIGVTSKWPWCSTAGCIGGHIIMLGFTPEERASEPLRMMGFGAVAAHWLGLDNSRLAQDLSGSMFAPGPMLNEITRQNAIDAVRKLYEDGVWHWRAVPGMTSFDYGLQNDSGDRGDPILVEWSPEPDAVVGKLFVLRDRIRKAYWNGQGEQPWQASLDNDLPVCLLTGVGAVTRDGAYYGGAEDLRRALRIATPPGTSFVHVSDSGLDNALALIDRAILTRLGVLPALRETTDLG